jgi:hypothetical protein
LRRRIIVPGETSIRILVHVSGGEIRALAARHRPREDANTGYARNGPQVMATL